MPRFILQAALCLAFLWTKQTQAAAKPNILFIAVDDLNDWVGCLGGHPQAKTPNIDKLAKRGILFEQAYCAAPLCSPSRTAIMTGLAPYNTGIYGNLNWFRDMPQYENWITLPQYFRKHGYKAWGGAMGLLKKHATFSKGIYVWCLSLRVTAEAADPVIEVVYGDEQHVGVLFGKQAMRKVQKY